MTTPATINDLLEGNGLDLKSVGFARHPYNNKYVRHLFEKGHMDESTSLQMEGRFDKFDYVLSFLGFADETCLFLTGYKIVGYERDAKQYLKEYPFQDHINEKSVFYKLERLPFLEQYSNKLMIAWGQGARAWLQNGTNPKSIILFSDVPIDPRDYLNTISNRFCRASGR